MSVRSGLWALCLLALGVAVTAQEAVPPATAASSSASSGTRWVTGLDLRAEQTRVRSERAAARARQAEEEAACQQRFAVTDCLDRVRQRWQPVLADIRRQEIALNDADRRQRSAERQRKLEEKSAPQAQENAARRRVEAQADHDARQARAASKASAPAPAGKPRDPQDGIERPGPELTREQEAANAQAHARRVEEAQARKDRMLKRQAERAKPPASALPVPP